jgi:hypothetical protein
MSERPISWKRSNPFQMAKASPLYGKVQRHIRVFILLVQEALPARYLRDIIRASQGKLCPLDWINSAVRREPIIIQSITALKQYKWSARNTEVFRALYCYAAYDGFEPTFREYISAQCCRMKQHKKNLTLHNNPEDERVSFQPRHKPKITHIMLFGFCEFLWKSVHWREYVSYGTKLNDTHACAVTFYK